MIGHRNRYPGGQPEYYKQIILLCRVSCKLWGNMRHYIQGHLQSIHLVSCGKRARIKYKNKQQWTPPVFQRTNYLPRSSWLTSTITCYSSPISPEENTVHISHTPQFDIVGVFLRTAKAERHYPLTCT